MNRVLTSNELEIFQRNFQLRVVRDWKIKHTQSRVQSNAYYEKMRKLCDTDSVDYDSANYFAQKYRLIWDRNGQKQFLVQEPKGTQLEAVRKGVKGCESLDLGNEVIYNLINSIIKLLRIRIYF
jgi:hypothetical protein